VTPTGLVLWPVRGPVLSLRVVRTAHWPKLPGRGSPRPNRVSHYRGCERATLSVWRPRPGEYCGRGIRGNVPSRFRRRPPCPRDEPRGFRHRDGGRSTRIDRICL